MDVANPRPVCRLRRAAAFLTQGRPRRTLPCLTRIRPAHRSCRCRLGAGAGLCPPLMSARGGRSRCRGLGGRRARPRGAAPLPAPPAAHGRLLRAVSSAQENEATYLTADRKKRACLRLGAEVSPSGRAGLWPHSASTAPSRPAAPASWRQTDKRRQNLTCTCEAAKTARFFNKGKVCLQAQFKRQKSISANETGEIYSN